MAYHIATVRIEREVREAAHKKAREKHFDLTDMVLTVLRDIEEGRTGVPDEEKVRGVLNASININAPVKLGPEQTKLVRRVVYAIADGRLTADKVSAAVPLAEDR